MSRSRLVGALLSVGLVGFTIVAVGPLRGDWDARLDSCPYSTTDFRTAGDSDYRLQYFPTPAGGFRYYASHLNASATPLVVLVAGYPDPRYFDAVVAKLSGDNYRVLVLDLPGKGHERLSGPPTAAFIVEQFQQLWEQLRPPTASGFLIVGTSVSSPVAALMAARWRAQNPRLALVSGLGMPRSWTEWRHPFLVYTGRIPVLSDLLAPFVLPSLTRNNWENGEILCPRHFPELFERQRQEFTGPYSAMNYLELTKALVLTDQTPVYDRVKNAAVPVWLINGERDPFLDQIDKLKRVLPGAQETERIANAAHIPFIEQPQETVERLKQVLGASF